MACEGPEQPAELVSLGVFDLAAEDGRGHLVRFVAHDEIPTRFRRRQLGLDVVVARELVEPRDDEIVLEEPVARSRRLELVVREDLERKMEPMIQFVLPLLRETSWTHHEAAMQV